MGKLAVAVQYEGLKAAGFRGVLGRGKLTVRGVVRPKGLSPDYTVRIEYRDGGSPEAWVEDPVLRPRGEGGAIPHVYQGPRPCLYLPRAREWTPADSIARKLVPWISTWLLFYEDWHLTGEWKGGGAHPPPTEKKPGRASGYQERRRRRRGRRA